MSQNPQQAELQRRLQERMPNKQVRVVERDGRTVAAVRDPETGEVKTREVNMDSQQRQDRTSSAGGARPTKGPSGSESVQEKRNEPSAGGARPTQGSTQGADETVQPSPEGGRGQRAPDGDGLGDSSADQPENGDVRRDGDGLGDSSADQPKNGDVRRDEPARAGSEQDPDADSGGNGGPADLARGIVGSVGSGLAKAGSTAADRGGSILSSASERVREGAEQAREEIEKRPGGEKAAAFATIGAPAAAADGPLPVGDAAVAGGTLAILGGAAVAQQTDVDERLGDELARFPQFGQSEQSQESDRTADGELPVGSLVPGNELEPGAPRQDNTELSPGNRRDVSELVPTGATSANELEPSAGRQSEINAPTDPLGLSAITGTGTGTGVGSPTTPADSIEEPTLPDPGELIDENSPRTGEFGVRERTRDDVTEIVRESPGEVGTGPGTGFGVGSGPTDIVPPVVDSPAQTTPGTDSPPTQQTSTQPDQDTVTPTEAPGFTTPFLSPEETPPSNAPTARAFAEAEQSRRPRRLPLIDFDGFSIDADDKGGQSGESVGGDSTAAPGFIGETIEDIALFGGAPPDRQPTDEELEEAAGASALVGEFPTATELFGSEEEQEAIEEAGDFFSFGGGR